MSLPHIRKPLIFAHLQFLQRMQNRILNKRELLYKLQGISHRIIESHQEGCPIAGREADIWGALNLGVIHLDKKLKAIEARIQKCFKLYFARH